jgi:type II secretory pathway pseudopilin PulG
MNASNANQRGEGKLLTSLVAFTLVETMVGAAIISLLGMVLLAGIARTYNNVDFNAKNLRAVEILVEKMELIRARPWNEITNSGHVPQSFKASFYNPGGTNNATNAFLYQGTVNIASAPVMESYGTNLRQVTITVYWTNDNIRRVRSMTTLVSPYGIQPYAD